MSLVLKRNIDPHTTLAIWKMEETTDELLKAAIPIPEHLHNEQRQREWISSRLLLKEIAPQSSITYNTFGAPQLSNGYAISISHSPSYCCMLVSKKKAAIDLELITTKAERVSAKFMHQEEQSLIYDNVEQSTLIWCAKECLFKLHQKGNLIFKEDLRIHRITTSTLETSLKNTPYHLHYEILKSHYLVYYYE